MSSLVPSNSGMFAGPAASGHRPSGALARQTQREIDQVTARVEVEAHAEQGRAFAASLAMTGVASLVVQAEAHMKVAPAGAQFYEAIIASHAMAAAQRISQL